MAKRAGKKNGSGIVCAAIATMLALSGAAFANGNFSMQQCNSDADRLFSDYLIQVNKTPSKVAQFYSQKVLADEVNEILRVDTGIKFAKEAGVTRNRLLLGRGDRYLSKRITCTDNECQVLAKMEDRSGKSYSFAFTYSAPVPECGKMLIDRMDLWFYESKKTAK